MLFSNYAWYNWGGGTVSSKYRMKVKHESVGDARLGL